MERPLDALPEGTKLAGYVIGRVLGRGGFGITYQAADALYPEITVAVKEFLPGGLALRRAGELTVHPTSAERAEAFARALASFEREARTLVALRHPNVVEVQRYIELNGTAYVVMKYEDGQSLADRLAGGAALSGAEIAALLPPLLDGLEAIHARNFLHRDIKPGNIYLRSADGAPVLIDFGAARQAIGEERKTSLSEIYTPGYAPLEQYDRHAEQGPFTDIYALGATLYRCVTGVAPPEAITRHNAIRRGQPDPLVPAEAATKGAYPRALLDGIRRALSLDERERPQTIAAFRAVLGLGGASLASTAADDATLVARGDIRLAQTASTSSQRALPERRRFLARRKVLVGAIVAAVVAVAAVFAIDALRETPADRARAPAPAIAVPPPKVRDVTLSAASGFPEENYFSAKFKRFVRMVNDRGVGVLRIDYRTTAEFAGGYVTADRLRKGEVDMASLAGAFYARQMPEARAQVLLEVSMAQLRSNGGWAYLNGIYREKMRAYFLARTHNSTRYHFYFRHAIARPNFDGLKLRGSPANAALIRALGGTMISAAPGDVGAMLERRDIDGVVWPVQGVLDLKWNKWLQYRLEPGFYSLDVQILVNLDSWTSKLDDPHRKLLQEIALEIEADTSDRDADAAEMRKQEKAGIVPIRFWALDEERYVQLARDAAWHELSNEMPAEAPRLRGFFTAK